MYFLCLFFASIVLRVSLLVTSQRYAESDECIIGVMAIHILRKGELSPFFIGQPYNGGGTIEAIMAAGLFRLFGISSISLKAVGLIQSLILVLLCFWFVDRWFGRTKAIISGLLFSLTTPMMIWNLTVRGGYMETMIFNFLIVHFIFKILFTPSPRKRNYAFLGLLSGAAWYNLELVIPMIMTCLVFGFLSDRKFFFKQSFLIFAACFVIGNSPTIYFNVTHNMENWKYVFQSGGGPMIIPFLIGSIPLLDFHWVISLIKLAAGFFEPYNEWLPVNAEISISSFIQLILSSSVFIYFTFDAGRKFVKCLRSEERFQGGHCEEPVKILFILLLISIMTVAGLYQLRGYRILLPVAPWLSLLVSKGIFDLYLRRSITYKICSALLLIFLTLSGFVPYLHLLGIPNKVVELEVYASGQGMVRFVVYTRGDTIPHVVSFLESHGISAVYTINTIKWRINFESQERVIAQCFPTPMCVKRYPPYHEYVAQLKNYAVVLHKNLAYNATLLRAMANDNVHYRMVRIDEMNVYYAFDPPDNLKGLFSSST